MKIILDTNAFYNYFGADKLKTASNSRVNQVKFFRLMKGEHKIYVTSYTILEAVYKYGNNYPLIKDILWFINDEVKNVFVINDSTLNKDKIEMLIRSDEQSFRKMRKELIEEKITIESNYSSFFLFTLSSIYLKAYYLNEEKKDYLSSGQGRELALNRSKNLDKELVKCFRKAYAGKNLSTDIKQHFNYLLYREMDIYKAIVDKARLSKIVNLTEFISIYLRCYKAKNKNNNNACEFMARYVHNMTQRHNLDEGIFIKEALRMILQTKINMIEAEYIAHLLIKWSIKGAKFEKNDIFDMMIVSSLYNDNTVLLSFDDCIIEFLDQNGHKSMRYITNVYQVN